MTERLVKPRCPNCNKVMADWVEGPAQFTCRHCHTSFIITGLGGLPFASILTKDFISVTNKT